MKYFPVHSIPPKVVHFCKKNCHIGKLFVYNNRYMKNHSIGACRSGEHGGIIMELTKELKEKLEKAENKEEAKKIIEEAGLKLTDAEMDQVAGGHVVKIFL